LSVYFTKGKRN